MPHRSLSPAPPPCLLLPIPQARLLVSLVRRGPCLLSRADSAVARSGLTALSTVARHVACRASLFSSLLSNPDHPLFRPLLSCVSVALSPLHYTRHLLSSSSSHLFVLNPAWLATWRLSALCTTSPCPLPTPREVTCVNVLCRAVVVAFSYLVHGPRPRRHWPTRRVASTRDDRGNTSPSQFGTFPHNLV
jgi:hypothetical protein